ncbi:ABC transporter permease [Pseudoflavonifractor sp. AF19-9AC]|uniref:ABC transporter permease n=1 Tax=Pseudoflavonifractor sp. AF19-9AC TaxID=2292244 RepID=UPI000E5114DF|nr:ABC transporter permease [Pseudoflavonifractor sp. AF19-9AC]RHR11345.1 ABC transporter permease [Pseudoflavonifractor sp. AF19-9AC]
MKKERRLGSRIFMGLIFLFLYAPILLMIVFSFNDGNSNVVWQGFSLRWYEQLFHDRAIIQSVYTTLLVSALATVIATIAGTFAAVGFYSMRRRTRSMLLNVNNIPMMNADIVTGVSLCMLFVAVFGLWNEFAVNYRVIINLFGTKYRITFPELSLGFGTMLIAHITFNIPYVILSVGPKLRQMDHNLVDAARDLGCTWMRAFFKVILPEIKTGIVSGALIAFTMSVDDFVISYFTAGSSVSTLAMEIYSMARKKVTPEINAVSTLLFLVVLFLLVAVNLREARQAKAQARRNYGTVHHGAGSRART